MASVRFICGTQDLHKQLETTIADFFGTEDTILYAACFDANGGLFEPLLGEDDAIISDALNHASIIDGVRLCKAKRYRYANCDMADLEKQLQAGRGRRRAHQADHHRRRVLDGRLHRAARRDHARWRSSTARWCTSTNATPPASSARPAAARPRSRACWRRSTSSPARWARRWAARWAASPPRRREVIELLRQRSRPYLFSNSLPPHVVAAGIKAFEMLSAAGDLRDAAGREHRAISANA